MSADDGLTVVQRRVKALAAETDPEPVRTLADRVAALESVLDRPANA